MKTNTVESTVNTTALVTPKMVLGDFRGTFKLFARNWYNTLKSYDIPEGACHLIAMDCSSDLGNALSRDSSLKAQLTKANKDGAGAFKLGGKTAYTKYTDSMSLIRICQQLDEWRSKLNLDGYGPVARTFESAYLSDGLLSYLQGKIKQADGIQWVGTEAEAGE